MLFYSLKCIGDELSRVIEVESIDELIFIMIMKLWKVVQYTPAIHTQYIDTLCQNSFQHSVSIVRQIEIHNNNQVPLEKIQYELNFIATMKLWEADQDTQVLISFIIDHFASIFVQCYYTFWYYTFWYTNIPMKIKRQNRHLQKDMYNTVCIQTRIEIVEPTTELLQNANGRKIPYLKNEK